MATYAIGDLQGCHTEFQQLLDLIRFDPAKDQLWLTGDLVNRGPGSLAILRTVKALGNAAVTVLGNHDLHLIAVAAGIRKCHVGDTLQAILDAPDAGELIDWLRQLPLVHHANGRLMVHAGLLPGWSADQAASLAAEVEAVLCGPEWQTFCANMYGNQPAVWHDKLEGWDRLRVIVNACTRLRFCTPDGIMDFKAKGRVDQAPEGFVPWFRIAGRLAADTTIICGHWSLLGLCLAPNVLALDSGCVWGGTLTALRLDDRRVFQVPCQNPVPPE